MNGPQKYNALPGSQRSRELVITFKKVNDQIHLLNNYVSLDLLPVTGLINAFHVIIREIMSGNTDTQLKEQVALCTQNIFEIVTLLQLHDIITQKLEHITTLNQGIVDELVELKNFKTIAFTQYLCVVKETMLMNSEQLTEIKKDFLTAVVQIQEKLIEAELVLYPAGHGPYIKEEYFLNYKSFEKLTLSIIEKMAELAANLKMNLPKDLDKVEKLKAITKIFTMESEREVMYKILNEGGVAHLESLSEKNEDVDQTEFF